jgi:hypothetical protein
LHTNVSRVSYSSKTFSLNSGLLTVLILL